MNDTERAALVERITDYAGSGGLFNPELMDHDAVRNLLLDCREALSTPPAPREAVQVLEAVAEDISDNLYTNTANKNRNAMFNVVRRVAARFNLPVPAKLAALRAEGEGGER